MIRPARPDDADAICAIWNTVIRDTLVTFTTVEKDAGQMADSIRARGPAFLVAEVQGMVAGFATYDAFRPGPGYLGTVEHSVHVAPRAQGAGLGRGLLTALEAAARAAGKHAMIAAISGANPRAVAFHAALGYVETGRLPGVGCKAGQRLDLVLMQKAL